MKILLRHDPEEDGNVVTTNLFCASGCFIPDGKWREYLAVCDIHKIVQVTLCSVWKISKINEKNFKDSPLVEKLGIVSGVTVGIHGISTDLNWYFDDFQAGHLLFNINDILML